MSSWYTTDIHAAVTRLDEVLHEHEWKLVRVDDEELAARFEWDSGFHGEVTSRKHVLEISSMGEVAMWEVREFGNARLSGTFRFTPRMVAAIAECAEVVRAADERRRKTH